MATSTFTQADINSGLISYRHNGSSATADSFDFSVNDTLGTGTTATFTISITPLAVEVMEANQPLALNQGDTATITNSLLLTTDVEDGPGNITYTITTAPAHGSLLKNGVATSTFTQADINSGLISYQHNNTATTADSFTFRVNDTMGAGTTATFTIAIIPTPTPQVQTYSLWSDTDAPQVSTNGDPGAVELGMKFRSDVVGYVTGVRFYKSAANNGTHTGNLWTADGRLLATVTFTNETDSGWQEATFSSPVLIAANTTYIVSYHAPNGHYAIDTNYFTSSGVDNGPLHALASGEDGLNGVAMYGAAGSFPRYTYLSSNYWVDVAFSTELATTTNAIVLENQLPGSPASEWDIEGAGSENIQGFTTEFSVNLGETVEFKIDTDATDYRLDIYRMGYYGGLGARKVATVEPSLILPGQEAPLYDPEVGLADAGNWLVTASWDVPTDAVSGVYIAKLVREDGVFGENHVIFVVRDDEGGSEVLFQTSDTTWQAYNFWGGNGLYGSEDEPYDSVLSAPPEGRAYKVSYNRPFGDRTPFFTSELPALRWLEANGYDVSYISGIDTDRFGSELLEHEVFLSVGHDEYWSAQQRENVEAARDAGIDLAFLSGNEVFWKTRWEPSIDGSGTEYRTLVSYKETHADAKIDPLENVWTGTWRDPRFSPQADGGLPENALTGQMYFAIVEDYGYSIEVPAEFSDLRFWRNTDIATLEEGEVAILTNYTLGYEWDEVVDNGFSPAGLIRMSLTTIDEGARRLIDYGNYVVDASSTHSLTLYRAESGALVFGAGTIQWSFGLDSGHDGPAEPADPRMQQAMVNLLADMGAQPGTLQTNLVYATASSDFTDPTSSITSLSEGQVLQPGIPITIRGTAQDAGGGVVGGVEVSTDGGVTWHFAMGRDNWYYEWLPTEGGTTTVLSRAVDDSGNLETPALGAEVRIAGQAANSLWNDDDAPLVDDNGDTQAVELGMKFRTDVAGFVTGVRFYKSLANTGVHQGHLWTAEGELLATATFANETLEGWQEVEFDHPVMIEANTTYVVSYHAPNGHYAIDTSYFTSGGVDNGVLHGLASGVDGVNGVSSYGDSGTFPLYSYLDSNYWVDVIFTETSIAAFTPASGSGKVPTNASLTATFYSSMDAASVNSSTWQLFDSLNRLVSAGVTYDPDSQTATLTPTQPLTEGMTYTSVIYGGQSGMHDSSNTPLAGDTRWSFTTAPLELPTLSIWDNSEQPAILDSGDDQPVELGMKFSSEVDGFVTGVRFYRSEANLGMHKGKLWSTDGELLAEVTFTDETSSCEACIASGCFCRVAAVAAANQTVSGWQQAEFSVPVQIEAGTTYIVSYYTESGHYSLTPNYFTNHDAQNGPLRALPSGVNGANGVYAYGAGGAFPELTDQDSNYWVDVAFVESMVAEVAPAAQTSDAPADSIISVRFAGAMQAASIHGDTLQLFDSTQTSVEASVSYNPSTLTATLTPLAPLGRGEQYTVVVRGGLAGVRDEAGLNPPADYETSFTVAANQEQVLTNNSPLQAVEGALTTIFSDNLLTLDADDPAEQLVYTLTNDPDHGALLVSGAEATTFTQADINNGLVSYLHAGGSLLPDSFDFTVDDGRGASTNGTFDVLVTPQTTASLWNDSDAPLVDDNGDPNAVEVGMKFQSDVAGYVTGVRFYKSAANTGTHIGHLWSADGELLASVTFTGETASGWQQAEFSSPVLIDPNTTYVVSYFAPNGHYAIDVDYFSTSGVDNGPLRALASGEDGLNGVAIYGDGTLFPRYTYRSSNYWVDFMFEAK